MGLYSLPTKFEAVYTAPFLTVVETSAKRPDIYQQKHVLICITEQSVTAS